MKRLIYIVFVVSCCLLTVYANAQQPTRRICTDEELTFTVTYSPVLCAGSESSALVNIIHGGSGNNSTFWWEWSTGDISQIIPIREPGAYSVTVTDTYNNCSKTENFTISPAPAVGASITKTDISCYGYNDGTMTAEPIGGTEPFSYNWHIGDTTQTISHLRPTTYHVTITDGNNCTARKSASIIEPTRFNYSITPNQGVCRGNQVTITANATGGVQPYNYVWSDIADGPASREVSPEETTTYIVTVTDANGCENTPQSTIVEVSQPIIVTTNVQNAKCHGVYDENVHAVINIEGGISPFNYLLDSTSSSLQETVFDIFWIPDSSTQIIRNLVTGTYSYTITDKYNCSVNTSFYVTEPDTMWLTMPISTPAKCFGYNGTSYIEVRGGTPGYTYLWDSREENDTATQLLGGRTHYVTVTDANGCTGTASTYIDQPQAVYVSMPQPNGGYICRGEEFNCITDATGGTGPHTFVWTAPGFEWHSKEFRASPQETTTYTLSVTDVNGCTAQPRQMVVYVNHPIEITSVTQEIDEVCKGEKINFNVEATGGNGGPYIVNVENYGVVTTPCNFTVYETGWYPFTVGDICGSPIARDSVFALVHELPTVGFYSDKAKSCPPAVIQFFEVSPDSINQSYRWNFGDGVTSTIKNPAHAFEETGVYNVSLTIKSDFGCENTATKNNMIIIYEIPRAEFEISPNQTNILNTEISFINYSEGGNTYLWNFGDGKTSLWGNDLQIHTYTKVGTYTAMLVAKNKYQCIDTAYKKLTINDVYTFYAPTAFTPNGDGDNDYFYISGSGIDPENFQFEVYDRWGERMFRTYTFNMEVPQNMGWDGTDKGDVLKGDKVVTTGPYNWVCKFRDFTGKPHEKKGTVFLMK